MRRRRRGRGERGVTLVELMIVMVIAGVVLAAALAMSFSLMDAYREHRRTVLVERSARGSIDIIEDALRGASPATPSGNIDDLVGCGGIGALSVINGDDEPDQLTVIHGSGGIVTSLREPYDEDDASLLVLEATGLRNDDLLVVSDLQQGSLIKISNMTAEAGGVRVSTTATPLGMCPGPPGGFPVGGYPPGSLVMRARISTFLIDDSADVGNNPTLMLDPDGPGPGDPQPLAEGIEDLQIAVGVDIDADGTVEEDGSDTDEWFYNVTGDADPPLVTVTPWRAVRVTVVARALETSPGTATSIRPAAEDRDGAVDPDALRRRVLSATVQVRNLEGSP